MFHMKFQRESIGSNRCLICEDLCTTISYPNSGETAIIRRQTFSTDVPETFYHLPSFLLYQHSWRRGLSLGRATEVEAMSALTWLQGLILVSPHVLMLIAVITVVFAVSSVFLDEEHIYLGVFITVFTAIAVALCIMGFWQN
ncbi:hypothetical protein Ocin01_09765 [Orchesella cincta]|uniref:Transmembrane protein n=1 Tax=Orchesella cincta TaxID=48709 RepID=A0A1D2MVI9_ORCCI|nr:hypothetical protein Ocin01_09765 [Orchesella cincta]